MAKTINWNKASKRADLPSHALAGLKTQREGVQKKNEKGHWGGGGKENFGKKKKKKKKTKNPPKKKKTPFFFFLKKVFAVSPKKGSGSTERHTEPKPTPYEEPLKTIQNSALEGRS